MCIRDRKLVEAITSMEEDFAQWYTDVVKKAELVDYASVKGCMVIKPAGYAIWENIQKELDARFKATGVENVYMPLFIPESLLEKEKDHVEGFAPEVAWVTPVSYTHLMQPQAAIALALADGTSIITESIFENRFRYVDELARMGARIKVCLLYTSHRQ